MNTRYMGSTVLAGSITFGLFFVMQFLVSHGEGKIIEDPKTHSIDFVRLKKEELIQEKIRAHPEKPPKVTPPPPMPTVPKFNGEGEGLKYVIDIPNPGPPEDLVPGNGTFGHGDVLPIVRGSPTYPKNAVRDEIEGFVVLDFTVSKTGKVVNPVVIYAEPSRIFNRSALRAIAKWKYKPLMVDGQPTERTGMRIRMTFEMEKS